MTGVTITHKETGKPFPVNKEAAVGQKGERTQKWIRGETWKVLDKRIKINKEMRQQKSTTWGELCQKKKQTIAE